jgi:hypothetical protein
MKRTIISLTILAVSAASSAALGHGGGGGHHEGGHHDVGLHEGGHHEGGEPHFGGFYGGMYQGFGGHHRGGGYVLGDGGWGFGLGAGQFMQGAGQFNLSNSQAAIGYQAAYSMWLNNRLKYEETHFEMRRQNAADRAAMAAARPHFTPQQYAANLARTPKRLSPAEWDPGHGVFAWPKTLTGQEFADDRTHIETLFEARDADPTQSGLGTNNYHQIKKAIATMSDHLHSQIKEMGQDEYIQADKFLKSLEHNARSAPHGHEGSLVVRLQGSRGD